MFAVAAALIARTAWPGTASGLATAFMWVRSIVTIGVLAALPVLVRRRLGPATDSRLGRALRLSAYAAITILTVALAELDRISNTSRRLVEMGPHNQPSIGLLLPWSVFILLLASYVAVILVTTAERSWVTTRTLAIGIGAGLALGAVMYVIMPLGVANDATAPWLTGSRIDAVVVLAWILLFGGPLSAAVAAGRLCSGSLSPLDPTETRIRQGVAAGTLAAVIGSLVVCTLGPMTLALLPSADWLVHLLYGQHVAASAVVNGVGDNAIGNAAGYFLIWLAFPIIGIAMGAWGAMAAQSSRGSGQLGPGHGGSGPGGPQAVPERSALPAAYP